jgi:hypothetical protein
MQNAAPLFILTKECFLCVRDEREIHMKKTIIIAALFAVAGFANAQNAADTSTAAPTTKPATAQSETAKPAAKKAHHKKHAAKKKSAAKKAKSPDSGTTASQPTTEPAAK